MTDQNRVKDWLYGVRTSAPEKNEQSITTITQAERLRNVYYIITRPFSNEGAGITAGKGDWVAVKSIFPLHDRNFNRAWIKNWSQNYTLSMDELTVIKDQLGSKVSYNLYFYLILLLMMILGRFLFCLRTILLHVLNISCRLRDDLLVILGQFLANFCHW